MAAFGADATAKLAPLIQKFDEAVNAAGGVEALAAQATDKLNELLPGAGDAVGGLLGAAGGLLGGLTGGGGGEEEGGNTSRGFGSALFSVALQMLTDPGVMQAVSASILLSVLTGDRPAWNRTLTGTAFHDTTPACLLHVCMLLVAA